MVCNESYFLIQAYMKRKDVFHIYWGTQGNAGLYLDEIYQVLKSAGLSQEVFVSYYYPLGYGKKVFFKYTDLISGRKRNKLSPYIRYAELTWGLMVTLVYVLIYQPRVINYSLISSGLLVEMLFFRLIHIISKSTLVLTCHDVLPFQSSYSHGHSTMGRMHMALAVPDFLLVHNLNSKREIYSYFGISELKILKHDFPIIDLSKIFDITRPCNKEFDYLFIGHLRKEKGLDILLEAWKKFHVRYPDYTLCIAGNLPGNSHLRVEDYDGLNITFRLQYLSDMEYCQLIYTSKCVVLPYWRGTNSGVVSTIISLGTDVIASDIPMFKGNPMLDEGSLFEAGNVNALADKLEKKRDCVSCQKKDLDKYRLSFNEQVLNIYHNLLNKNEK